MVTCGFCSVDSSLRKWSTLCIRISNLASPNLLNAFVLVTLHAFISTHYTPNQLSWYEMNEWMNSLSNKLQLNAFSCFDVNKLFLRTNKKQNRKTFQFWMKRRIIDFYQNLIYYCRFIELQTWNMLVFGICALLPSPSYYVNALRKSFWFDVYFSCLAILFSGCVCVFIAEMNMYLFSSLGAFFHGNS